MSDAHSTDDSPRQPALAPSGKPAVSRFSLERLSSAFARLMGASSKAPNAIASKPQVAIESDEPIPDDDSLPVTPRMIVEGMLFVGAEGRLLSSREMSSHIRDVQPAEVDAIVVQLNEGYRQDDAAYEIVGDASGYRLQLRADLSRMRDRIRGRARAAKLTPAAMEVLAIIGYRQGVSSEEINRLRGSKSHAITAQLVRRQLVRVDRMSQPLPARYFTTERFNQLFGVRTAAELPKAEDLADA